MTIDPFIKLSEILRTTSESLSENPRDAYILRKAENEISKLAMEQPKAKLRFVDFFFKLLRHHVWVHVAGDASVKISDEKSERIIQTIANGLYELSQSVAIQKDTNILHALINIVVNYLDELEKGD